MMRTNTFAAVLLAAGLLVSSPASGATKVRKLDEGVYLLTHRSSMSANAAGAVGLGKIIDKAAALCHLEGFSWFTTATENVEKQWSSGLGGEIGGQTARVECFREDGPEGALEAEPLLLPKTLRQLESALKSARKRAAKRGVPR